MAYTPVIRQAIGDVRRSLETIGVTRQSTRLREHGRHEPDADAPLVLVACSGGRDSLALASIAATVCGTLGVRCGAVIVDHALFAGSADVADQAAERCRGFGMDPVAVRRVIVPSTGVGVEADAREARYRVLVDMARELGAAAVLLAHTRDDQAETVLLGLMRTVGLDALAGMPAAIEHGGVPFLRPFLNITRAQTTHICETRDIDWWDDPSNGDAADEGGLSTDLPLRSRIRHALLPYLIHFVKTDMVAHLSRSARIAQRDKDYLDAQAAAVAERLVRRAADTNVDMDVDTNADTNVDMDTDVDTAPTADAPRVLARIDARALAGEHAAIRSRVIFAALHGCGVSATSRHIEAIDELVADWHGQGPVRLSSVHSATRQGHVILLCHDGVHENR